MRDVLFIHTDCLLWKRGADSGKKSGISCEIITVSQYPQILESARCLISGGKVLENPFSEEGITASIRFGVAAAWEDTDAFLFLWQISPIQKGK